MGDVRTPDLFDALRDHIDIEPPDGLVLGWRSTRPDLRSRGGFRWAWPGQWTVAPDDGRDLNPATAPGKPCPDERLGGLCLAKTWWGARSGGIPAHVALLVAFHPDDVLGENASKLRVRRALTLDVIDVCAHARAGHLAGANLAGADLTGAYLTWADLTWADLTGADLAGADLAGARGDRRTLLPDGWRVNDAGIVEAVDRG